MSSISKRDLGNSIFTIRGYPVMIDFQLAELYDVETKRINEQVKRIIKRFPVHFMFQLNLAEWNQFQKEQLSNVKSSFLRPQKEEPYLMFLPSKELRYAVNNRMNRIEDQMENLKNKVDQIDLQINTQLIPTQGIFFDGQVFDAYALCSRIIRFANKRIVLIDNYIDESTFVHLSRRGME